MADIDRVIAQETDTNIVLLVNAIAITIMGIVWIPGSIYQAKRDHLEASTLWLLILVGSAMLVGGMALLNYCRFRRILTLYEDRLVVSQWGKERVFIHSDVAELISKRDGDGGHFYTIVLKNTTEVRLPYFHKETNLFSLYRGALKEARNG